MKLFSERLVGCIFGLAMLAAATSCGDSARRDDHFEVTGEFRADGSCDVRLNGQSIATAESARAEYTWGNVWNVAPQGLVVHEIACHVEPSGTRFGADATRFGILASVPQGRLFSPGTYRFRPDATSVGDTISVEGALFHPRFSELGITGSYLLSTDGTLTLTSVQRNGAEGESGRVVGTFHFRAHQKARGM